MHLQRLFLNCDDGASPAELRAHSHEFPDQPPAGGVQALSDVWGQHDQREVQGDIKLRL